MKSARLKLSGTQQNALGVLLWLSHRGGVKRREWWPYKRVCRNSTTAYKLDAAGFVETRLVSSLDPEMRLTPVGREFALLSERLRVAERETEDAKRSARSAAGTAGAATRRANLYARLLTRIRDGEYAEPHETPQTIAAAGVGYAPEIAAMQRAKGDR